MSRHFYSQTHTHRSILTLKAFHTAIKSLSNVLREERMNSSLVQSQQEIILVV